MKRHLITLGLIAAAALVVWALTLSGGGPETIDTPDEPGTPPGQPEEVEVAEEPAAPPPVTDQPEAEAPAVDPDQPVEPIPGLHAVPPADRQDEPVIGSTERDEQANPYLFQARFTPYGAGIINVRLSRYSTEVNEHVPYPVQRRLINSVTTTLGGETVTTYRYPMAAYAANVNGTRVYLYNQVWELLESDADSAAFALTLADENDQPVLRITRTWRAEPGRYDLALQQRFENLSGQPLRVRLTQHGPFDLPAGGGYIGDRRHVVIGYLQPYRSDADRKYITIDGFDFARNTVLDQQRETVWPAPDDDPNRDMAWAAMANRYFAAALHASVDRDNPAVLPLENRFPSVGRIAWGTNGDDRNLGLMLESAPIPLAPAGGTGDQREIEIDLYAGPKDPAILEEDPVFSVLGLDELIVYSLGGFCAILTFAWVADILMAFLSLIAGLIADWGVAIMVLVAVVRIILHPLTKRSQVNMMKMGKQMQTLQPEIERLKKKYKDNPTKLNQEMMNLYRERGVNPAMMGLGCLPMFLQMPIWFALYAMLYFAIELRHESAFWGIFQRISGGDWLFLADLSSQDHFLPLPAGGFTIPLVDWTISAVNLLPILMIFVFYMQQKYTTAATPAASEQAAQQQKMMKWMVMLFPIFLYKAPSGLNLYILSSTAVGVIESYRVRKHLKELEDQGKLFEKKKPKEGGFMDRLMKAAEERQKQLQQQRGPNSPTPSGKPRTKGKGKGKKRR